MSEPAKNGNGDGISPCPAQTRTRMPVRGEPTVRIRGLNHVFGQGELKKQVLFENELDLLPGEIVIMTGPSGSGKTTLLTLIGTLRSVQQGSLQVLGRELRGLSGRDLIEVRRNIGFIFQAHNLFESLTAVQNVRMALELCDSNTSANNARAAEMLTLLGLGHRLKYKPGSLSGGQRQRVAISRALANRPRLILADEPTAALDKESGRDVVNLLQKFAKEERCTIMLVTHDNRILDVADRIVNMVDGRIISDVLVVENAAIAEFLRKIPLFSELTPSTLARVADAMSWEEFQSGQVIVRQGDQGDKFYLIRKGAVEVRITGAKGERSVATLRDGDFFGEKSLVSGEPRNATVVAKEQTEVYTLGKDEFSSTIEHSSTFKEEIRKVLFERQ
jgi:putative ABC transport system ATP-binding protein